MPCCAQIARCRASLVELGGIGRRGGGRTAAATGGFGWRASGGVGVSERVRDRAAAGDEDGERDGDPAERRDGMGHDAGVRLVTSTWNSSSSALRIWSTLIMRG